MDSSHRFKLTPEYTIHHCISCKISVVWLKRRSFTFIFFITASANIKSEEKFLLKKRQKKEKVKPGGYDICWYVTVFKQKSSYITEVELKKLLKN